MSNNPIKIFYPRCKWIKNATWRDVDRNDKGEFYPIIVCPKCYNHIKLIYPNKKENEYEQ